MAQPVQVVPDDGERLVGTALQLPGSGEELEMDLLKEALEPRRVTVQITPAVSVRAVSLEDTVGLKARAWHDRFVIRDIIDLHAVAGAFSYADLENLARRHDPDLDLAAIRDHLAGVGVFADEDNFAEYGLDELRIADLGNLVTARPRPLHRPSDHAPYPGRPLPGTGIQPGFPASALSARAA